MRIVMSIKEWENLMKHIDKNEIEVVTTFEIGNTDENTLGVKHLVYLSNNRLYGYNLKESAEKFYNIDELSDEKVSFDINARTLRYLMGK